jgi:Sec-independent protein secretion pathway component TatC
MNFLLNLAVFGAAIIGPPIALWYGIRALGRGLNSHPKTSWAIILLLLALLFVAAASFSHFFPNCHVGLGLGYTQCHWRSR